ncbi:MAG: RNA helicase [Saprospiraceae bacterium]|nr:MAG: RNA helicase [Saprospiraceae bacterium]
MGLTSKVPVLIWLGLKQLTKITTLTFKELGLNEQVLEGLSAMGFETATPIQEKAIPAIMEGRDLIACAQTGTGKTAAFLLPTLHNITQHTDDHIDTLILVPTRELAVQIDQQLEGFAYFTQSTSLPIYGGRDGTSFDQEKRALTLGANILVATPGRLITHLQMNYVKIDQLRHLILDEADRMLDMGFINDIQKIISYLPKVRQTLMFSATMPNKIRQFAKQILKDPVQISFAVSKPAEGILQATYEVHDDQKLPLLTHLLEGRKNRDDERILIFSSTKLNVKKVAKELKGSGLNVKEIHSDLEQEEREDVLRNFKNGNVQILVATDILSRGIDVKGINIVVNYDVPGDAEDYIHRVGRTARAQADGVALTFINRKDQGKFRRIEELMEQKVRRLPLPPHIAQIEPTTRTPQRGATRRHGHVSGRKGGSANKNTGRGRR